MLSEQHYSEVNFTTIFCLKLRKIAWNMNINCFLSNI
uniref:Uncharacterized protein n=1 Tax=Arundo donax TaxID=35708 RepID=A0A0A9H4E3_ARUDO